MFGLKKFSNKNTKYTKDTTEVPIKKELLFLDQIFFPLQPRDQYNQKHKNH